MLIKNNNKYFILICILIHAISGYSQNLYVETGLGTAAFRDYKNSEGINTLSYKEYSSPKEISIESGISLNMYKNKINWDIGVDYSQYKINTAFYSGNITIPTTYDLSYFSLKTGINATFATWKKLKFQIHGHLSYDWLIFGTNKYNNVTLDIYKNKSLDRTLLRYHIGVDIAYTISKNIQAYINYNIGNSFKEKNKDSINGESYSFQTKSISLGMTFTIHKDKIASDVQKEEIINEDKLIQEEN